MTKFSAPQQNQLAQIGAFLRENREKQEKSLEDIAIRTYIRPQLLNGIETGNPDTLPEPIFVQGFIRRYGEALGLNGIELSKQFTVNSIPSTPRPTPAAPIPDTPTTRLTRAGASSPPVAASIPTVPATSSATDKMAAEDLTLGRLDNDPVAASAKLDQFDAQQANYGSKLEASVSSHADYSSGETTTHEEPLSEVELSEVELSEVEQFDPNATELDVDIPVLGTTDVKEDSLKEETADVIELDPIDKASEEKDFSSMVADFDKENMGHSTLSEPSVDEASLEPVAPANVESAALSDDALVSSTVGSDIAGASRFNDDLPDEFTTQPAASMPIVAPVSGSTEVSRPPIGRSLETGYEANQPNLKPFVLGGVLAAIALLGVLIASVIGGGNRQPEVVENPDPIEQVEGSDLPPLPEDVQVEESAPEDVETAAAVSDAPIFVEATATREAWVSIIADGETIFEDTLQPGDSQVWEAQENLSIYSGDAGALELAANGEESEVMGESGQPDEKVFPE